jgi:hypothetical protein
MKKKKAKTSRSGGRGIAQPLRAAGRKPDAAQVPRRGAEVTVYILDVYVISGPMTRAFASKNKVLMRTIQIPGSDTLEDLHRAIFRAFNREQEHLYEFQVGGRGPMDPKAQRYVLRAMEEPVSGSPKPAGDVRRTTLDALGLKVDDAFGYWFDFGDDWWHQINVAAIERKALRGGSPQVLQRVGESPPQYPDEEDEST